MTTRFSERVVLITGAARGLGRAVAQRFLDEGARVGVHVRTPERAAAVAGGLRGNAFAVAGDLTARGGPASIVGTVVDRFQRLDVLVNNAAVAYPTRIDAIPEDEWRETIEVNLTAAFLCLQAAIPVMKRQQYGRIVNVSSTAGRAVRSRSRRAPRGARTSSISRSTDRRRRSRGTRSATRSSGSGGSSPTRAPASATCSC